MHRAPDGCFRGGSVLPRVPNEYLPAIGNFAVRHPPKASVTSARHVAPPAASCPVCYEDYEDPTRKVKKSQEGLLSGCGAHDGRSFQRELKVLKVLGLRSRT